MVPEKDPDIISSYEVPICEQMGMEGVIPKADKLKLHSITPGSPE